MLRFSHSLWLKSEDFGQFFFAEWGDLNFPDINDTLLSINFVSLKIKGKKGIILTTVLNPVCIAAGSLLCLHLFMYLF